MSLARLYNFTPGTALLSAQINSELNQIVQLLSGAKLDATILKASSGTVLTVDNTGGGIVAEWKVGGTTKTKVNTAGQIESVLATGTAPIVVASTTVVPNLNADKVDGKDATDFLSTIDPVVGVNGGATSRIDFSHATGHVTRVENRATVVAIVDVTAGVDLLQIDKTTKAVTVFATISGVTPTSAAHLATKAYTDSAATAAQSGAASDANTISGLTGGSDGKVVRWSSGSAWVNADKGDTADQLEQVLFKSGGLYYRPGSVVPGLSGLSTQSYWLYTSGDLTPSVSFVAPSSTQRQLLIGRGLDANRLLFYPSRPITG